MLVLRYVRNVITIETDRGPIRVHGPDEEQGQGHQMAIKLPRLEVGERITIEGPHGAIQIVGHRESAKIGIEAPSRVGIRRDDMRRRPA